MGKDDQSTWRWHVGEGLSEVERLAPEWNALAHTNEHSPTADAIWTACAWRAFASSDQTLHVHSLRDGHNRLLAVLPLVRTGRIIKKWEWIPDLRHHPRWDFAFDTGLEGVGSNVVNHLLESNVCIDLKKVTASRAASAELMSTAKNKNRIVWYDSSGQDALIDLNRPWECLRVSLPRGLRNNTERKIRQLSRMGRLSYNNHTVEDNLESVLGECFALEVKGWKGRRRTAIACQPQTLQFYTELAHISARESRLALYLLRLDDRLIAFDYCIRAHGRIEFLKTGYDPELARHSPGNVLRYLTLKDEAEKDEISHYYMGLISEWKERWANRTEDLFRIRIFRKCPTGMMIYYTGPRLRSSLRSIQTLRRAVRWARGLTEKKNRIGVKP